MSLIKIFENENFIIDYDKEEKQYRASYFVNNHWVDECWFDPYEEEDYDNIIFPQTIGNITYYNKGELFDWVKNQQQNNEKSLSEALEKYELLQCRITDEEFKEILDKFCELPLINPIPENSRLGDIYYDEFVDADLEKDLSSHYE